MTKETLKRAKELEDSIAEYSRLIGKESYFWCMVKVRCANCAPVEERYGVIPRPVWEKMLDVLRAEKEKLEKELASL